MSILRGADVDRQSALRRRASRSFTTSHSVLCIHREETEEHCFRRHGVDPAKVVTGN